MSTAAVIAIIVGALIVLAIVAWAMERGRERRNEQLRRRAGEERNRARDLELHAVQAQAIADEKAARARRESAQAEERAREAARQREVAGEHTERARKLDPDGDGDSDSSSGTGDERPGNGVYDRERTAGHEGTPNLGH